MRVEQFVCFDADIVQPGILCRHSSQCVAHIRTDIDDSVGRLNVPGEMRQKFVVFGMLLLVNGKHMTCRKLNGEVLVAIFNGVGNHP